MLNSLHGRTDWTNLPKNFADILKISFERIDSKTIFKETGLKRPQAHRMIEQISGKLFLDASGKFRFQHLTKIEIALIMSVANKLIVRPAFDDRRLFLELLQALTEFEFLLASEHRAFRQVKNVFALFTVTMMHDSTVILDDGWEAKLQAGWGEGTIKVMARLGQELWPEGA